MGLEDLGINTTMEEARMKGKFSKETRKVYVPVLVDSNGICITDGEEFDTEEEAVHFASAMVEEYIEECDEECYARIETRVIPVWDLRGGEQ